MTMATTVVPDISLTAEERAAFDGLRLDASELFQLGYQAAIDNGEAALRLVRSLEARAAIPAQRLRWFTEADSYHSGRKSLKSIFEGNNTKGDEIPRHPHFLRVLRYFICGPDLPASAKSSFAEAVRAAGGHFTSDDVLEVADAARRITRAHGLRPHEAAEEFHKLALDHGIYPTWARRIYDRVRTIRNR